MPCFKPLDGYRSRVVNPSGKRSIVFSVRDGYHDLPVKVPCGQCIGCRIGHSKQWALRAIHEASLYPQNCFVTLTYDDNYLPDGGSIVPNDPVLFMKRLRKRFGAGIRSFGCAEYGEQLERPHYHLLIFNFNFPDRKYLKSHNGFRYDTSEELSKLWEFGYHWISEVTYESAAYVARYVTKKITGKAQDSYYGAYNCSDTGEKKFRRSPERPICRSLRPAIGRGWFEKYQKDVFPDDFIVHNEKKFKPPHYYDKLYELANPTEFNKIKIARKKMAKRFDSDWWSERLKAREFILLEKCKKLKRKFEEI